MVLLCIKCTFGTIHSADKGPSPAQFTFKAGSPLALARISSACSALRASIHSRHGRSGLKVAAHHGFITQSSPAQRSQCNAVQWYYRPVLRIQRHHSARSCVNADTSDFFICDGVLLLRPLHSRSASGTEASPPRLRILLRPARVREIRLVCAAARAQQLSITAAEHTCSHTFGAAVNSNDKSICTSTSSPTDNIPAAR